MENLEEALINLMEEYIKKEKKIDSAYIRNYLFIISNYYKLEQLKLKIKKVRSEASSIASYNPYKIRILFNPWKFNWVKEDNLRVVDFSKEDKRYFSYIYLNYILSHEIKHIIDINSFKENMNYEGKIKFLATQSSVLDAIALKMKEAKSIKEVLDYYAIYKIKMQDMSVVYKKYYSASPLELSANQFGCVFTLNILKKINEKWFNLPEFIETFYLDEVIRGYSIYLNPSYQFIKELELEELYPIIPNLDKLSLEKRIELGLLISKEEYGLLENRYKLLLERILKKK